MNLDTLRGLLSNESSSWCVSVSLSVSVSVWYAHACGSYDVLMILASLIGAMNVAPFKYMWWFAAFVFLILIIVQLLQRFEGAKDGYKLCNYIFIATACVYPLVWMLGSEGTAALGLSQEVGIITVTDLVAKLGFGLYFLFNFDEIMGDADEDGVNQQSQQYV